MEDGAVKFAVRRHAGPVLTLAVYFLRVCIANERGRRRADGTGPEEITYSAGRQTLDPLPSD